MRLLELTAQIWMKVDTYYQRQKCRPMNLVSENIRFMRIFAGIPLGGGVKWHWGLSTTAIFSNLGGYVFKNFRDTASNIIWRYATPCLPANDYKEWPWVAFTCQNAFSASTSWIRAFECLIITQYLHSAVFCALHDRLASLCRHAQLTRCFSALAALLV